MFSSLYNNLLKIYPSIQLPEPAIYNYIVERYYIETGVTLTGTSFNIAPNMVIVKSNEYKTISKYIQYIHNNELIDIFIIPYNMDRYSFDKLDAYSIIYNIVFEICDKYIKLNNISHLALKTIFEYAPFVISTVLFNDLFVNIKSNDNAFTELLNILDPDLNISLDLIYNVIQLSIEDLLDKGKIIPLLEQEEERRNKITEELYNVKLSSDNSDYDGII